MTKTGRHERGISYVQTSLNSLLVEWLIR
jgi:hypothetical protein